MYHNTIKNNIDKFKNYFCNFKDDMNENVKVENNEVIFDIATRFFPQVILQSSQNKNLYSLHFLDEAKSKPTLEEDPNPNCVYVANLGFVNLINICDNNPLVLKNTSVYLDNLIKRDVTGYLNKTNDNCNYVEDNDNENNDSTRTFSHLNIVSVPNKRKFNSETTVNLINKKKSDFNYSAYNNLRNCPTPPTFDDYVNKYRIDESSNCLRKV